jgi:hypothetical protein
MKVKKAIVFMAVAALMVMLVPGMLYADTYTFAGIGDSNYGSTYYGSSDITFHFDVTGVDLDKITSAALTISAHDVDEEYGEIDDVYFNGTKLGHLSGEDDSDSTTIFYLDPGLIVDGQNDVIVDTDAKGTGWRVTVHWGQLYIETSETGGTEPDAVITGYSIVNYDNSGADVVVNTTMHIHANVAGTYNVEANLIDPNSNNIDLFTGSVTAASDGEDLTLDIDYTYAKSRITGTYTINGMLFTDTSPPVLLSTANTSFEHEQDTGLTQINEDTEITDNTGGGEPEEPAAWVRDRDMICYQVWVNEDNAFEFVFWWEYKNNNWVKIYDMAGSEVFSIDMPYRAANFTADLPDGMYTVKTFHKEGVMLQEFIIGKP